VSFIIIVKHKEDNYSPCHGCRFRDVLRQPYSSIFSSSNTGRSF